MEAPKSIACNELYTRTIYSFAIPEVLTSEESVRNEFHQDKLLEKLRDYKAMPAQFDDFQPARPIYDFTKKPVQTLSPDHRFIDEFWRAFWPQENTGVVPFHFPFQARYTKAVERSADWFQSSGLGAPWHYASMVKCRYFPYGAASIHLTEYFRFSSRGCTAKEMVNLTYSPIKVAHSQPIPLPEFFAQLQDAIIRRVLKQGINYDQMKCKPQAVILNPTFGILPAVEAAWQEVATVLAMDVHHDPDRIAQYTPQNTPNQGRPDQFFGFSPYTCLLLAPDLDKKWRRRRLRNHIGSIAELVAIQHSFLEKLRLTFARKVKEIESKQGFPMAELGSFWKNYKDRLGRQVFGLSSIFELQESLQQSSGKKWSGWYGTMVAASRMGVELQAFEEVLKRLDQVNKQLGSDVRKSLTGIFDKASKLMPSGA